VDVAHVAYVANVSEVCCKRLFKNVQLFQSYVVASGFMLQVVNLDVSCASHICCEHVFQMFHLL
jgi:hypothetical protein